MIITCRKESDEPSRGGSFIECQFPSDLFKLQKILVPPGEVVSLDFSSNVNLVMMISGSAGIECDCIDARFQLDSGQVWLASAVNRFLLSSKGDGAEVVAICISIQAAMLDRFYERYSKALLRAKNKQVGASVRPTCKNNLFIFPECDLVRFTLDSFNVFSQLGDDGLMVLKLEELLLLKLNSDYGRILADELLGQVNPENERFRRFMEANVTQNWSMVIYAKHIGMSLTAFKNMFGRVFREESPKAWINTRRLRYADIQLKTSNKRLVDVALDNGFSSQSYFTQLYKAKYGLPPSEVRQKSEAES
ncbi:AraC family transcriptional regulator [Microbulbifer sp. OS29]|uniref:AraC family transcriptional regulator n=1 Tax=Microbulbifer okhotskensis TaxID=2926617 RepID=A0A9X2J3F5_9GAMM|nr:AraC family transcriptional regulator [Microbulbifer okhotskensis]MCO1333492.1 AraC family transcriptional regulator [Microbulbifer okhotskensis]